ncbi:histidine kinase [Streptomyces somaliensis]|uniref:sensor histidine kinase n=1 Tax=Streptomyces somaliensis TaxID=78355 RepID=UPI0020CFD928|nr:histidine kinase [Streptomyces somaliensis]MCP9944090.1 histidine kinase [Streptomyces somaliensis]MCP9962673.1 histidine kinase [Streptomyces somaliensis]
MTTTGAHQDTAGMTPRGFGWWGRRRGAALDIGLGAVSALECAAEGAVFAGAAHLPTAGGALLGLAAGSALVLRRCRPVAVVLVSVAVTPAQMGYLMAVVGLYTLAASDVPRRITASLAATSTAAVLLVTFLRLRQEAAASDFDPGSWYVPLVSVFVSVGLTAPPVLLGLYVGARRRLMESLRERADSLEQELSLLADQAEQRAQLARTEERTRIAREMHDVVAHRVSLMVVHAAALQAVALKDPRKAADNAALVGEMGRQALTELREMLGVLRAEPVPPPAVAPSAASAGEPPAVAVPAGAEDGAGPGLGDVEELVEQSRAAGTAVELLVHGEARAYAPHVEQTAYRVVQEALTNVHKHAAGARVVVRLAHRGGEVAMQVENGPCDAAAASARLPSGGNGLLGMRERVTALGGVFVSGPTDEGGFRVSAVLPAAR